jgi:hypothetical protein
MSREAFSFINKTPILQSLLYDLNLLPEQLKEGTKEWDYMMATVLHFQACEAEQSKRIAEIEKEVKHWKSNHEHEVERARLIKIRTDLPLERAKAYDRCALDKLNDLQAQNAELMEALEYADKFGLFADEFISEQVFSKRHALKKLKQALAKVA